MSRYRVAVIRCDQCERRVIGKYGVSKRDLKREMRRRGWDINYGRFADLCPSCSERAR